MLQFNQAQFIKNNITNRSESYFVEDIDCNFNELNGEIQGMNVLVIGGAGTIGSSFIKAILPFKPKSLVVVDYSENGLTELTRDLRSRVDLFIPKDYITYPIDFGGVVFEKIMKVRRFDIIACFAAHKHVRSEKDHFSIEAMIRNNVFNTKKILDSIVENPPKHFFCVSTDKAANPVNVMGASKKVMEKVLMAYTRKLKITTARFANVAFSNGSLLFGFVERIMKNQPLVAPIDVKRYFVSPEESGQLCLLACILGHSTDIFFPKLSTTQMMTFSTIAEAFLEEIGLVPDYCETENEARIKASNWKYGDKLYPVFFFKTDTSGEKSFEEFFTQNDTVDVDTFKSLGVVKSSNIPDLSTIESMLSSFEEMFERNSLNKADVIALMSQILPNFCHIETGKSLDQKM